ncbi:GNAT family N-acetyltransferase [Streptomyces sp. NBC_01089]|uniref:GNAT family N-acetyltransferase n=1 Tax=Streptomyces sp. NBC_01089 TaxID=2903747 RepID=UPI003870D7AC|nr:GNAT family N-acetyltransferase [Streptomyces sp. NBC_01089]
MTWTFTRDLDSFLATAEPAAALHPAENTLVLTITAALRRHGPRFYGDGLPLFGWWRRADGTVNGWVVRTPPHPLQVGVVPAEAVPSLAHAIGEWGVTAVSAERSVADTLTASWPDRAIAQEQRLYRLAELTPPSPCPAGRARTATVADRALLIEWHRAFARDTGQSADRGESAVDDRISYGGLALWEHGGVPVSMAGMTRPAAGTVRVAPVYTPPGLRGRGYAAAVTAHISRAALDTGAAGVLLFTDIANPTSNGVYRRVGYRPLAERVVVTRAARPAVTSA